MQSGPKYRAVSVDFKNASSEQQNLFKNIELFFDPNISELMQLLGNRVFMNKNLKINVKFESNIGRATLEKDSTQPIYQLTLSSNARSIDTLFDFIHALYDINSRTFDQTLTDVKFLDHRFYNAFKVTFEAMHQMFSSTIDHSSLGIDKADLEHLRNAIPGQSHQTITVNKSVAKDFTLKTMEQEFAEYSAVSKDESGSKKISIFTKKPEYSIKQLPKPAATITATDLKAQAQASKSQVFVDRASNTICCSICAQSGTYSIVIKNDQGYYCDRGGYIDASAVLEAEKFIGENPKAVVSTINLQQKAQSATSSVLEESASAAKSAVAAINTESSKPVFGASVSAIFTAPMIANTATSVVATPASPKSAAAATPASPKSAAAATPAAATPAAATPAAATPAAATPAAATPAAATPVVTTAPKSTVAISTAPAVATLTVAGPAFNGEVFAQIERIKDSSQKALATQRAQDLPKQLMANLLELLNANPENAAKFLAQKNDLWVKQVINAKGSSQQLYIKNLPQKIALNEETPRQTLAL